LLHQETSFAWFFSSQTFAANELGVPYEISVVDLSKLSGVKQASEVQKSKHRKCRRSKVKSSWPPIASIHAVKGEHKAPEHLKRQVRVVPDMLLLVSFPASWLWLFPQQA
jgi:hypothetical protein